jgi:two-component system chemotaxis response regulator CheB
MLNNNPIKVMVVDDSVLVRKYVSQILGEIQNIEVIATAPNGKIAAQKIFINRPDVIILDIEMPEMDGIEFLRFLKENTSLSVKPQVILFSSLVADGSVVTFEGLALGAADFIRKPEGEIVQNIDYLKKEFEMKIKNLFQTKQEKLQLEDRKSFVQMDVKPLNYNETVLFGIDQLRLLIASKAISPELLAIGSSTGGPQAIRKIMESLGKLSIPVVIAQHMPAGFTRGFAANLSQLFQREVVEAGDGTVMKSGVIYICPGGSHVRIFRENSSLILRTDAKEYEGFFFKPSVDLFFRSVREAVGKNVLAVILSGMGKDGALEAFELKKSGAMVMAQDKESSAVWGMPGSAVERGGVDIVIDLKDMGNAINLVCQN